MKYVYLLKVRQIYSSTWTENDLVFQSTANVWFYLQDLWKHWEQTLSEEDLERLPPVPTLGEIRAGLSTYNKHILVEVGFVNHDDPMSLYVSIDRMYIY